MTLDPDYTVVSDFSATGKTRGALDPVLDMAGDVLRPRKPGGMMTDVTDDRPDISQHELSPHELSYQRRIQRSVR